MMGILAVLAGTRWTIFLLVCTNDCKNSSLTWYEAPFLAPSGQTYDGQKVLIKS